MASLGLNVRVKDCVQKVSLIVFIARFFTPLVNVGNKRLMLET